MKNKFLFSVFLSAILCITFFTTTSNSSGAGGSSSSCSGGGCHSPSSSTTVALSGVPTTYTPGQTYLCSLVVSNAAYTATTCIAGFKLTASAGYISSNPSNTTLSGLNLRHNTPQAMTGGSSIWVFNWTAPSAGGSVVFNMAGNATNGNTSSSGDAWNSSSFSCTGTAASSAPSIQNITLTGITTTTATIGAQVNPNNSTVTSIQVQYGLTISYGTTVNMTPFTMTGTTFQSTVGNLSGLLPNTLYHLRIIATNASGTTYSNDTTFSTAALQLPAIQNVSISALTANSATIGAQINPNNTTVTSITADWGTTTSYGNLLTLLPSSLSGNTFQASSATLSSLIPNTTYHLRINAINNNGTTTTTDTFFTTSNNLDISQQSKHGLKASPNPFINTILLTGCTKEKLQGIGLFDITGRCIPVLSVFNSDKIILNTENVPSGVYTLRYKLEGTWFNLPLLK